jgi:hypothetical protein
MGVQPNVISERNEKKIQKIQKTKTWEKSGLAGGRKRTGGISDTTRGRESVRRTMCRWPRLCARCARGSRRQVTARSLTLWIHERQGQSESPSAATSASSDRSSALCVFTPSYMKGSLKTFGIFSYIACASETLVYTLPGGGSLGS